MAIPGAARELETGGPEARYPGGTEDDMKHFLTAMMGLIFTGGVAAAQDVASLIEALRSKEADKVESAQTELLKVGTAALAPRLAPSLAGLILISGTPATGTAAGLPALVVHGERDMTASALAARSFATRNHARYAGFDGGHFVLVMRREETRAAIAGWLAERAR